MSYTIDVIKALSVLAIALCVGGCQHHADREYYQEKRESIAGLDLRSGVFVGTYVSYFETSWFQPCGSDERWWLENLTRKSAKRLDLTVENVALVEMSAKITADDKAGVIGDFGTWLRHTMSIEEQDDDYVFQGYGHLGQYDREIYVENVLEIEIFPRPDLDLSQDFEVQELQEMSFREMLCPVP